MNREEYIANLNQANELYHHGVKGQKWGVRNYQNADGSLTSAGKDKYGKHHFSAKAALNRGMANVYSINEKHYSKKNHKNSRVMESMNRSAKNDFLKRADAAQRATDAKYAKKDTIKSTYKDIQKNTSFGKKLIYNNATRRKAANYVVNNGMSVSEATKKAEGVARRNTVAFLASYGAITAGILYKHKKLH